MAVEKPRKHDRRFERDSESAFILNMWQGRGHIVGIPSPRSVHTQTPTNRPVKQKPVKEQFRALLEKLCAKYPSICTDPEILGGSPCIKGTRLSVRIILGKLHLLGSIQAIVDSYEPHLSEEQVKDAIAYAQDFMELACDPNEP